MTDIRSETIALAKLFRNAEAVFVDVETKSGFQRVGLGKDVIDLIAQALDEKALLPA